jgi:hypothetical protein
VGMSKSFDWDKLSPETRAMLERASEMIVPIQCGVVMEVRTDGQYRRDGEGTLIRCGKPFLGNFGCVEHGLDGDPRKDMVFRDLTPSRYEGPLELEQEVTMLPTGEHVVGLTVPEDYKPHAVTDGGVGSGGVRRKVVIDGEISADQVVRFLPQGFIFAYEQLVDEGYSSKQFGGNPASPVSGDSQIKGKAPRRTSGRLRSSEVDKTLMAEKAKRSTPPEIQMRSEKAVDFRKNIDRRLRRLGREIKAFLAGENPLTGSSRKCAGKCGKLGDAEWSFCARCGGPMRELDKGEA